MRDTRYITYRLVPALLLTGALLASARAQLPSPPKSPDSTLPAAADSIATYVARNPGCHEITNGCQVCVRTATNEARCSTPGIACQPSGWRCGSVEPATADPAERLPPLAK